MRHILRVLLGCSLGLVFTADFSGVPAPPEPVVPVLACPECNDDNPCTVDGCDTTTGTCRHILDSRPHDRDSVTDSCNACPALYNPGKSPDVCRQAAQDIMLNRSPYFGRGSGMMTWSTTHEMNVSGFNVQVQNADGTYTRLNQVMIPCLQCVTGGGAIYAFIVPRLKGGRGPFVEMLDGTGDQVGIFGPASGL